MTTLRTDPAAIAPADPPACAHCGLAVPAACVEPGAAKQFCCNGCKVVHGAIQACGLDRYYAIGRRLDVASRPARTSRRRFDELDDPAFRQRHCRPTGTGLTRVQLVLEGVHCAACLWLVERLPQVVPGVAEARLDLGRRVVRIVWDDAATSLSAIARQLAAFGYVPHASSSCSADDLRRAEDRRLLVRLAVAGALAGNVMLISFALYGGLFHGIEAQYFQLFRWTCLALTLGSLAWPGRVFFTSAIAAIRARTTHMDVPIAVGLAAGLLWSAAATISGVGEVYFDSVTLLVFLLLVGRWMQARQQRRSNDAIELLFSMTPRHALLVEDGRTREVPVDSLRPGSVVEIQAGETVCVDGVVIEGASALDMAWLTGETRPITTAVGDHAQAGSVNVASRIRVRVERTGADTEAGRLMQLVEACAQRRAPIVQLADRIAGIFVVGVLIAAGVTALVWWMIDGARAVEHAIALLIITCPCALGLATPLAIIAGIGRAARRGILIKGGSIVEALTRRGVVVLDKTGTITAGRVELRAWHGPDSLKPAVAAIETGCSHPVARALVATLPAPMARAEDARVFVDGAEGSVDGRSIIVGSRSRLRTSGIALPAWAERLEQEHIAGGLSPVFVARDGVLEGVAAVGDSIRSDAAATVATLRRLGWNVAILSGDHPEVVRAVGAEIGVDPARCHGGVDPEQKLRFVEQAARDEPVVMVGDGVNDAAALAAATIGVAVHGGAEASLASADVYLGRRGLSSLPELIVGSTRTIGVIRRGLAISLAYNVIGCGLAMAGLINPLVAAILMPASSLTVITLALRARTFGATP